MTELILLCEDLFGIEILELINQINLRSVQNNCIPKYKVLGYLSNKKAPFGNISFPLQRLGSINDWQTSAGERFVLGISKPESKNYAVKVLKEKGARFETIIASWSTDTFLGISVGEGSIVWAYSVKRGIEIGNYVTVIGAMLSGKKIGDYSTVLRFSNIAGSAVGTCTYVGNHVFLPVGKVIGDNCLIADGSVIVKSVKDGAAVAGVPAKKLRR